MPQLIVARDWQGSQFLRTLDGKQLKFKKDTPLTVSQKQMRLLEHEISVGTLVEVEFVNKRIRPKKETSVEAAESAGD
jgi:hypothetical protein